jgi:hypothetical protein
MISRKLQMNLPLQLNLFFLHKDVVVLTRLTTRSPTVRYIHFCVWLIFSWFEAI